MLKLNLQIVSSIRICFKLYMMEFLGCWWKEKKSSMIVKLVIEKNWWWNGFGEDSLCGICTSRWGVSSSRWCCSPRLQISAPNVKLTKFSFSTQTLKRVWIYSSTPFTNTTNNEKSLSSTELPVITCRNPSKNYNWMQTQLS